MIFLGITACSQPKTMRAMPINILSSNTLSLSNAVFDELYITKDLLAFTEYFSAKWDKNTVLLAKFDNNLNAGNVAFTADNVTGLILRRKELKALTKWVVVKSWSINNIDDFTFKLEDKYNLSKKNYIYSLSPVSGDIEGNMSTQTVYSDFEGLFLATKETILGTPFNVDFSTPTKNKPNSINIPISGKYPFVVQNGDTNYSSGTLSAVYMPMTEQEQIDNTQPFYEYAEMVMNFLQNEKPIVLKYEDGRGFLCAITTPPSLDFSFNELQPISFGWTEIGDLNDTDTLVINGMISVEEEGV